MCKKVFSFVDMGKRKCFHELVCESADAPESFKSITWISLATWNVCHFLLHLYKWVWRKAWACMVHRFHFSPLCFSWHILPKRPIVWNHEPIISPWHHQDAFVTTTSRKWKYLHIPKNQNASSVLTCAPQPEQNFLFLIVHRCLILSPHMLFHFITTSFLFPDRRFPPVSAYPLLPIHHTLFTISLT